MMVAVVFDGDHDVWPAHVKVRIRQAVGTQHGKLSAWRRKAGVDEQQPQIAFLRRLRAGFTSSSAVSKRRSPRAPR